MNKSVKYIIAVLMLYMAFAGYGEQATKRDKSRESYQIIIQRNIFSKNRTSSRPVRVDAAPVEPNKVPAPDISFVYVLRGVALNGEKRLAFIENQSSEEFFNAVIGEQVDGMTIKDIKSDRVVFIKDKSEVEIMVGMDLTGIVPGAPRKITASGSFGSATSKSPESGGAGSSTGISGADESEILRQMMERRKQQVDN